jgi:hypothetical protein
MPGVEFTTGGILLRALVLGLLSGAGLVLTHVHSRRGPMLYPVYAATLLGIALMLAQFDAMGFALRFGAALLSLGVASLLLLLRVSYRSAQRRALQGAVAMGPSRRPPWGMPLVATTLLAGSAAVAFIVR